MLCCPSSLSHPPLSGSLTHLVYTHFICLPGQQSSTSENYHRIWHITGAQYIWGFQTFIFTIRESHQEGFSDLPNGQCQSQNAGLLTPQPFSLHLVKLWLVLVSSLNISLSIWQLLVSEATPQSHPPAGSLTLFPWTWFPSMIQREL